MRINKKMALLFVTLLILALTGVQATAAWKTNAGITGLSNKTIQPQGGKITTPSEKPTSADLKAAYATEVPASVEKSGGEVKVTAATVENYFKDRIFTADNLQKLPLFKVSCDKASLDASPDVVVMHALDDAFAGKKPSELNVIKVLGPNSFESYAGPTAAAALANKKFAVVSKDAVTVMAADAVMEKGCFIALCLRSSDIFNVGKDHIIDPAFVFTKKGADPVSVASVTVKPSKKVIKPGGSFQFTAVVSPDTATNKKVTWASSKETIATVADGLVKIDQDAANGAEVQITATSEADITKKGSATVTVGTPTTGVEVDPKSVTIPVGETRQLVATVAPEDATVKTVAWTSDKPEVATVADGKVTGKAVGQATITVTTEDGDHTAKCTVTVTQIAPPGPQPKPLPPAVDLPDGIEPISNPDLPESITGLPSAYSGLVSAQGGRLFLVSSIMDKVADRVGAIHPDPLPVFGGVVSKAGASAAFSFSMSGSGLVGHAFSDLRLIKVKGENSDYEFTRVTRVSDLADGKFTIVTSTGTIRGLKELVHPTDILIVVIKDNGVFDMDPVPEYILDPSFLAQSTRKGSSGGCSIGFAPAAMLLLAPLFFLMKK